MSTYEEQKNNQLAYRVRRKERIVYVMGDKCAICGYNKCIDALDLHHINPEAKEFSISARPDISWERTIAELPKCVLLCANCHRELHSGLIKQELITSFNQQLADEITQEIQNFKTKTIHYCMDCGIKISDTATRCTSCAIIHSRIVQDRPCGYELACLVAEYGFVNVGKKYGVSDNAVRKWCKADGLPTHKSEIKNYVKNLER